MLTSLTVYVRGVGKMYAVLSTSGEKCGLSGTNGSGKAQLVPLVLVELAPRSDTLKSGTNTDVVYCDQFRGQIDDNKTVADNIAGGATTVTVEGRSRHVISYLQDFLFSPDRARTPARFPPGGERHRPPLTRPFPTPAHVLVIDTPTKPP